MGKKKARLNTASKVRQPGKRVRPNRPTERAAVRAVTGVFEDANMLVQPVDAAIDIGKDLYIDLTEGDRATGEVIAVQVKGGLSYRRDADYAIPCSRDDIALWAESTIPIFGIVHDPETERLLWTNLTAWARARSNSVPAREAPVSGLWNLDRRTLPDFVSEARNFLNASGPPVLVGLVDDDSTIQRSAIYDAFALGRRDPRPLLLVRASLRYMEDSAVLRLAIHVLCLCVGHGDIFWTPRNWVDPSVGSKVRRKMDWNYEELCLLLSAAEPEEYTRGGLGQDVVALVWGSWRGLEEVVIRAEVEAAWPALMILIERAGSDALGLVDRLVPRSRSLGGEPVVHELRSILVEHGCASMW